MRGLFIMPTTCITRTQSCYSGIQAYLKSQICRVSAPVCTESFNQNFNLERHIRVHIGDQPFACSFYKRHLVLCHLSVCTQEFIQGKIHLALHCVRSLKLFFWSKKTLKKSHWGKPFNCSMCEKSIRDSKYPKIHIRIHTGEKPLACSLCEKSFSSPSQLREHSIVHTGEKPLKCPHCSKSRTTSGNLKARVRVHIRNEPFSCTLLHFWPLFNCIQECIQERNHLAV